MDSLAIPGLVLYVSAGVLIAVISLIILYLRRQG